MAARVLFASQNGQFMLPPIFTSNFRAGNLSRTLRLSRRSLGSASLFSCRSSLDGEKVEEEPFVLTTPLYYVNAPPHMGSAYTTIAADAIARFQARMNMGRKSPLLQQKMVAALLDIAHDKFIRTTKSSHEAVVKEFYARVLKNNDIYQADYEGLYCINCEEYKDEKDLLDNNCCPVHLKPCVLRKENNYFFALSKYQKPLEEVLNSNPAFVQPSFRLNEVQSWINSGLRDFSISRSSVEWGIPVPNDNTQTIYVWFDALLGYISALLDDEDHPTLDKAVSSGWPASLHLIGKDGMKMGKSLGNTLEPKDLVHRFGSDAVRYFFLREVEFGNDGDYSEERFINSVNAHLANTIGNLLNRTLGLLKKNCQSTLPVDSSIAAAENSLKETIEKLVDDTRLHYENLSLSSACEAVLEIGHAGNLYLDERAPWSLFKQAGPSSEAAAKDLVIILETMRIIAIALSPITPSLSMRIFSQLGYSKDQFEAVSWADTKWGGLKAGQVMPAPSPVFARIETEKEEKDSTTAKKTSNKKEKVPQV
ncbi:hypothetical protein QJS04_geneDACA007923 [Acorus gramineus]|uniref:methionine--tRNA ligase n=1 Tax=Acorus gramineus TaxID=55184 RepID=A0AAV9BAY6_ACOGR|nr:hypothetical protein QJS04_geneDACA007923 [Acorus gramineus]